MVVKEFYALFKTFFAGLLSAGLSGYVFAQDTAEQNTNANAVASDSMQADVEPSTQSSTHFQSLRNLKSELKNVKASDFKVNAKASQPDEVKDPLQPLNRQFYAFNDYLDRNVIRPVAVQYVAKTPEDVRGSYRQFRKNLGGTLECSQSADSRQTNPCGKNIRTFYD